MPKAGSKATISGIYKCTDCGEEIVVNKGRTLPPCRCRNAAWLLVRPRNPKGTRKKATAKRKKRKATGRKKKGGFLDSIFG